MKQQPHQNRFQVQINPKALSHLDIQIIIIDYEYTDSWCNIGLPFHVKNPPRQLIVRAESVDVLQGNNRPSSLDRTPRITPYQLHKKKKHNKETRSEKSQVKRKLILRGNQLLSCIIYNDISIHVYIYIYI